MPKIVLTRGLPGSGKSTWAKAQEGLVRVSRDDLRMQLFGKQHGVDEEVISTVESAMVRNLLRLGHDVVVDSMHLQQRYINRWQRLGYPVEVVEFEAPLYQLLAQNQQRDKVVPASYIHKMFAKFAADDTGKLKPVTLKPEEFIINYRLFEYSSLKPDAYIVDIDGTLAYIESDARSVYDYTRVHTDKVHEHVAQVVNLIEAGAYVVIVSGRKDECRDVTEQWLLDNNIKYDYLYMRETKDNRADMIVKAEILEKYIAPHFNVRGVFDDRPSVCEMWRKVGLPTFQVGDPDNRF